MDFKRGDRVTVLYDPDHNITPGGEGVFMWGNEWGDSLVSFVGEDLQYVKDIYLLHDGNIDTASLSDCSGWYLPTSQIKLSGPPLTKEERVIKKIHELNDRYTRYLEWKKAQHA